MIITAFLRGALLQTFVALSCFGGSLKTQQRDSIERLALTSYSNPIVAKNLADPTILKATDDYFYVYATEGLRNVPVYRSRNLTNWEFVGTAFNNTTRPSFEPKANIWAPDINYVDDKYVMYYSMSVWGGEWTAGIGVAVADSPVGPFRDYGKLFRSNEINVQNSIDPFFIDDNEKKYLFWGSFRGIYAIELSGDGLSIKKGAQKKQIAGTAFEGTYIYKRGKYFYLFASTGSCCEGVNSTYQLVVGRSENLLGPYVDKQGKAMMKNGYSKVIGSNERFVGNGHNSEIVKDNDGREWFLYHGIDKANPKGRLLMLDEVKWDDSAWPFVETGSPSLNSKKPRF